jgi:hypothetical protein
LPEAPEVRVAKRKSMDASEAAMRIVAAKNVSGGITFDEVLRALQEQGYNIEREYLHTILNRKKNYQGKLRRDEDTKKWFLTDKGKQELGIE